MNTPVGLGDRDRYGKKITAAPVCSLLLHRLVLNY